MFLCNIFTCVSLTHLYVKIITSHLKPFIFMLSHAGAGGNNCTFELLKMRL